VFQGHDNVSGGKISEIYFVLLASFKQIPTVSEVVQLSILGVLNATRYNLIDDLSASPYGGASLS
jgi:hypothetical protein